MERAEREREDGVREGENRIGAERGRERERWSEKSEERGGG